MITYNGTPMLSRRDFIDEARKLDNAFADVLEDFWNQYEYEISEENVELDDKNLMLENHVEVLTDALKALRQLLDDDTHSAIILTGLAVGYIDNLLKEEKENVDI